jgi:hypothetical protein
MPYCPVCRGPTVLKKPHHDDGLLGFLPVSQRQEFIKRLAARIRPAMSRRRAHHQIGLFVERHLRALAVNLGRRRDEHQLLLLRGVAQDHFGAVHVGFDRVHRPLDDQLHADAAAR